VAVKRPLAVKIDGKERIVDIDEGGVRVDGKPVDVTLTLAEPGVWILRRESEQTVAQVDGRGGKLAVEIRRPGRDAVVLAADVSDARRESIAGPARAAAGAAGRRTTSGPSPRGARASDARVVGMSPDL